MDKKQEEECESYYRVTINGNFEDFKTIPKVLKYIKKTWKNTIYCSIRYVKFLKNGSNKKSNSAN